MKRTLLLTVLALALFVLYNANAQDEGDYYNDEYYEDEYEEYPEPDWKYLFLDLGYGGDGPSFAFGFRYWQLGISLGVTGFANDIPDAAARPQGMNTSDLPKENYPSNVVCGDLYGYYDLNKINLFVNLGFYSAIDSVFRYDAERGAYYRDRTESSEGICWGFGAQYPLENLNLDNKHFRQLVAGVGYHSRYGVYIQASYRWD